MKRQQGINKLNLLTKILAYFVMISFTILTIGPLCWLLYSSFKPHSEITRHPLALPAEPTIENYNIAWVDGQLGIAALNSIFYTSAATVFTVIFALAAGFAFSKFEYRITKFFYAFFILGLLISVHSVLVPLFVLETKVGLANTRFGVILTYIAFGLPFCIYLATTYIKSIPNSMIEAAQIDGANYFEIFWQVILPFSKPIVSTMIIFTFLANWNEFVLVFTLTSKSFLRSLPVGISAFAGGMVVDFGLRFASLSIGTIPMIVFYLCFRNQIEKGFAGVSVKE